MLEIVPEWRILQLTWTVIQEPSHASRFIDTVDQDVYWIPLLACNVTARTWYVKVNDGL